MEVNVILPTLADKRTSVIIFGLIAVSVGAVAIIAAGLIETVDSPDLLAAAIAFDLLITVPLAFFFLVIRRNSMSLLALAPVVGAGWLAAFLVLPAEHRAPLYVAEIGAFAFEVFIVFTIGRKAWKAARDPSSATGDTLTNLRRIAVETIGNRRLGAAAGTEFAALYYALVSWFRKSGGSGSAAAFSYHKRSGLIGIAVVLMFAMTVEVAVLHVLLSMWSPAAAWVVTALTFYGGIWFIGHFRASVLRPVIVTEEAILFRSGILYDLDIPFDSVARIDTKKPDSGRAVSAAFFGEPTHWIVLSGEIEAEGAFGFTTKISAIGFIPDEPEKFGELMRMRIGGER